MHKRIYIAHLSVWYCGVLSASCQQLHSAAPLGVHISSVHGVGDEKPGRD